MANLNLNKVILGGRLSFTIACARKYAQKAENGAQTPQSDFINCVAWRQTAEFISRYFHKGSSICVVGRIQTRSYTDTAGNKRHITEVVVDETCFVDSKSDRQAESDIAPQAPQFEVISDEEELPF